MVAQTVHLKTFSSLGHRTRESQVMQFPVTKSRLPPAMLPFLWDFPWIGRGGRWSSESESEAGLMLGRFFLENRDGNG